MARPLVFLSDAMKQAPAPDLSAAVEWPKVPACYGWLSLDRRGCWRLKGHAISHPGLISFINSHYGADVSGNWVFQNGPQAVFVALDSCSVNACTRAGRTRMSAAESSVLCDER